VVGTCEVVDVVEPLTLAELQSHARRSGFRPSHLPYPTTYAWVVRNARRLPEPVPYRHPPGAVIWDRLDTHATGAQRPERHVWRNAEGGGEPHDSVPTTVSE
jgi:hypothetical protein